MGCDTKNTLSEYTLSIGTNGLQENFFPVSYAQDTGNSAVFCFGCAHVKNFRNFSRQQNPLATHLWVCHRDREDLLFVTEVMVHVRCYENISRFHLAWSCPCTIELNPQVYSEQQQIPANFHTGRSTFGRMTAEKPVFDL